MKIIFIVSLLVGLSSNVMAADYYNAKFATTDGSYTSSTQISASREVCGRATGDISNCTRRVSCGSVYVWPTPSQVKKFTKWFNGSPSNIIWITDGQETLCKKKR